MNLLAAKLYDPAVAVTKNTTAAIAMTALDTTNLRLAVTVPAHGMVRFRLMGVLHGATTFPSILLGVLNGATVVGRVAPVQSLGNTAVATALVNVEADFIATGLTPGATNFDAAYAVETLVASTGLKYGGPNNTTANDAFGAFVFEAWDPQSQTVNSTLAVDANGRVDVSKVAGTAQTARDLGAQLDATVSSRSTYAGGAVASVTAAVTVGTNNDKTGYALSGAGIQAIWDALTSALTTVNSIGKRLADNIDAAISSRSTYAGGAVASVTGNVGGNVTGSIGSLAAQAKADVNAEVDSALDTAIPGSPTAGSINDKVKTNLDATVSSRLASAGYTAPPSAASIAAAVWDYLVSAATTVGSLGKRLVDNLDATVSSRSTYAGGDTAGTTTLLGRITAPRATNLDNLDAAVSSRSTYAGGDTAGTTTLLGRLTTGRAGNLDNLDAAVSTRATQTSVDTLDDYIDTEVAGIKAKTDNLPSDPADQSLIIAATDAIMTRIGAPAGASVSADVAAIATKTAALPASPAAAGDIPTASAIAAEVLSSAAAAPIAADVREINGTALTGNGGTTPWGPA